MKPRSLLYVGAVPIRVQAGEYFIDDQTLEGIEHWCREYDHVTYTGLVSQGNTTDGGSSLSWRSLQPLISAGGLSVQALPVGYRILSHARHHNSVRRLLGDLIARHEDVLCTIGGLFGDWGALGALEARKQNRRFAIWFDRVEHEVLKAVMPQMPRRRRMKTAATLPIMRFYHRYLVRRATMTFLQGRSCYDHYAADSANPQLVYDTHTKEHHFISAPELESKVERVLAGKPLRLVYAGRAAPMKGAIDWVSALAALKQKGALFEATWLGDGPQLEEMRSRADAAGLEINLPGFVSDREFLLKSMREADLFVFCHLTPESPRCLIEALVSGTPIAGYTSAYAQGLLEGYGGGRLAPLGDHAGLAELLHMLDRDRPLLSRLMREAALSGLRFEQGKVYRNRAQLLRRGLAQEPAEQGQARLAT